MPPTQVTLWAPFLTPVPQPPRGTGVGPTRAWHGRVAQRPTGLKLPPPARARRQLTVGTPEHLRALDIENAARNQLETR